MIELYQKLPDLFRAYGSPVPIERVVLSARALKDFEEVLEILPDLDEQNCNLSAEQNAAFLAALKLQAKKQSCLSSAVTSIQASYEQHGACIVSFGAETFDNEYALKKKIVFILQALGQPFGVFKQKGFWQTLGVDPNAADYRAQSTGYIPLHIDFDQATCPPDGVMLFCVRPDPRGGGESLIFNHQKFLSLLSQNDLMALSRIEFSYSVLFEQNGIGEPYNPHPLLELRTGQAPFFRYNGKVLTDVGCLPIFCKLEHYFHIASARTRLKSGDMLITDQNKTLHGREALNLSGNQVQFSASQDRLLIQTYLRHRIQS